MDYIINGIQQIGIGVADAKAVFNWYRKNHGFDILVFDDEADASLMTRYTNDEVMRRRAILSMNMRGGGGLEIWQFTDSIPQRPEQEFQLGDLGINMMKLRCAIKPKQELFTDLSGNWIQAIEDDYAFEQNSQNFGGIMGAIIGVSDMEKSLQFYQKIFGLTDILRDGYAVFEDFSSLPGGDTKLRRVLLSHPKRAIGGFGNLLGPFQIELIQAFDRRPMKIFENRRWGDLGYIHLCFDVNGMDTLKEKSASLGFNFTVDSANSFDMGKAAGRFAYLEDPDGTLIELVETHKVPICKPLGMYINLKNRNSRKPLPDWMVKAMKLHRVKKDL